MIIRETRGPVLLFRCAKQDSRLSKAVNDEKRPSILDIFKEAVVRPSRLLFLEPVVFILTLWSSFCFGLVFISTQSVAQVYSSKNNFSDAASGWVQSALFVGEVAGFFACLPQNRYYQRSASRNSVNAGVPIPEARLPLSIPTSLIGLAGGLFWYGWSSFPHIHWIVPTFGLGIIGKQVRSMNFPFRHPHTL